MQVGLQKLDIRWLAQLFPSHSLHILLTLSLQPTRALT